MSVSESLQEQATASRLLDRCVALTAKVHLLDDQRKALMAERDSVQGQLDQKALMDTLFLFLLERTQKRAVGLFEKLLTSMLQDVVPAEGQSIALELSLERGGRPGLHFGLRNRAGFVHSVTHGTGGSISNIVAAGSRMIALYRASGQLRPFLVFDEADHWMEPGRVGAFYGILRDMSRMLGLQTLVISHSPLSNIFPDGVPDDVQVLRLHREQFEDVQEDYSWVDPTLTEDNQRLDPQRKGLRSIRLRDYRAHRDSFYPLAEGMNFLVGPNNGGKSNVTEALKCILQGAPEDGVIRDGCAACIVSVETEEGTLHWTRRRAGSPKERYQWAPHAQGSTQPRDEAARFGPPDWVLQVLRMGKIDDMSLQISEQKGKTFLLDESASRRAEILSVGQASSLVYALMEDHRNLVKVNQERLKALDRQLLDNLTLRRAIEQSGLDIATLAEQAQRVRDTIDTLRHRTEQANLRKAAWDALQAREQARHVVRALRTQSPAEEWDALHQRMEAAHLHLETTAQRAQSLAHLRRLQAARSALAALPASPRALPHRLDSARKIEAGKQMARYQKLQEQIQALRRIDLRNVQTALHTLEIQIEQHQRGFEAAHTLKARRDGVREAQEALTQCDKELDRTAQTLADVQSNLGSVCPMCGQTLPHEHNPGAMG